MHGEENRFRSTGYGEFFESLFALWSTEALIVAERRKREGEIKTEEEEWWEDGTSVGEHELLHPMAWTIESDVFPTKRERKKNPPGFLREVT